MTNWEKLVSGDLLQETAKERKTSYLLKKVAANQIQQELDNGWQINRTYVNGSALMQREKPIWDAFEDEVWSLFYEMGFQVMNLDRDFHIDFGGPGLTKQIDVVAIDDDVCLLIECKATAQEDNSKTWKTELEAIDHNKERCFNEIKQKYPNRKCKYIFATKNYVIGNADNNRMKGYQIANFDYETIKYYSQLVTHLGKSAKYQLLGNIFAHQTIPQIEDRVPAIEGKMGNLTYYSFVIEPERLLKVAYILHQANHQAMSTYQRLIKKDRLKAIREYVNSGGFFPNSLIISIDTDGRGVRFDQAHAKIGNSAAGTLYIPKKYQSVYVIDGQHRLYGYSESQWATSNSIPVVAFVDLPKEKQLSMFMDINQNQKPVSKALRNTLIIDLLWGSKSAAERQEALMLKIAQQLGEDSDSPLRGRVVIGEDSAQGKRCITLEYIKEALKKSNFFNTYKKNNDIQTIGTFGKMDNDATYAHFYPFLLKCLQTIKDYCQDEWNKGSEGYLTINNTVYAVIKIINDIVNIVLERQGKSTVDDTNAFFRDCESFLLGLCDTINKLEPKTADDIKKAKGGSAKKTAWDDLRVAFHYSYSDFIYPELQSYIDENCVDNNSESEVKLSMLFKYFKEKAWELIPNKDNWLNEYFPQNIEDELVAKTAVENNKRRREGREDSASEWELLTMPELSELVKHGNNWSLFANKIFAYDGGQINKQEALFLLKDLISYWEKLNRNQDITSTQFTRIKEAFDRYLDLEKDQEAHSDGTNS